MARTFTLPPEQAMALAQEGRPVFIPGAFQIIRSVMLDELVVRDAFKSGRSVGWHDGGGGREWIAQNVARTEWRPANSLSSFAFAPFLE